MGWMSIRAEETAEDEEVVGDGEADEQPVEDRRHPPRAQDRDRQEVP